MKSILQQIADKTRKKEKGDAEVIKAEIANPSTSNDRRSFLKKAALGGIALGGLMKLSIEDTVAQTNIECPTCIKSFRTKNYGYALCSYSSYGRYCNNSHWIQTRGIYGLGEVRDGADPRYALMLKSRILGLNPCNVEMTFKIIKQFGGQSRQGGRSKPV